MKKIYNSPQLLVEKLIWEKFLTASDGDRIEITSDKASHDSEVLSKENNFFGNFEDYEDDEF